MIARSGLSLLDDVLLAVGRLLRGGEPTVVLSSVFTSEERGLLAPELKALGRDHATVEEVNQLWARAARRSQAEKRAVEAWAEQREAQNKARLDTELARRIEAYKKHVPNEIQIIALQIIEAEAKAKAEAEANIPKLNASIEQLDRDNRELSISIRQLKIELQADESKDDGIEDLQDSVAELSSETRRLREELGKSTAEARRASADTSELRGQVTTLSAAKAALERRLRVTGREREQLVRLLEGAAAGPLDWRATPSRAFGRH